MIYHYYKRFEPYTVEKDLSAYHVLAYITSNQRRVRVMAAIVWFMMPNKHEVNTTLLNDSSPNLYTYIIQRLKRSYNAGKEAITAVYLFLKDKVRK